MLIDGDDDTIDNCAGEVSFSVAGVGTCNSSSAMMASTVCFNVHVGSEDIPRMGKAALKAEGESSFSLGGSPSAERNDEFSSAATFSRSLGTAETWSAPGPSESATPSCDIRSPSDRALSRSPERDWLCPDGDARHQGATVTIGEAVRGRPKFDSEVWCHVASLSNKFGVVSSRVLRGSAHHSAGEARGRLGTLGDARGRSGTLGDARGRWDRSG